MLNIASVKRIKMLSTPPVEASDGANQHPDDEGNNNGQNADDNGNLAPVDGAGQDIPPRQVGTEGVLPGGWGEFDGQVGIVGVRLRVEEGSRRDV
jgi:hypothetical protein